MTHLPCRLLLSALCLTLGLATALPAPALARGFVVDDRGVLTLAPVVERATAAVVNIAVEGELTVRTDPFFRRFFNLPDRPQTQEFFSAGSGVVVEPNGTILTNHHVVRGARRIVVTLQNGRQYDATLVGSDEGTEIAVIRIPAEGLPVLPLGRSETLKVGDLVIAVGNPFGLGQSVTSGIVSGLGRSGISDGDRYEDFIQTDASINPGNSGGALINSKGELIGINTAILAPGGAGGNIGIGFAVPIDMARGVMQQILRFGEVRRGIIGVRITSLTAEMAEGLGLKDVIGALVAEVMPGSSAEKAGLKSGDVIVAVNNRPLTRWTDVRNRLALLERDSSVRLTFLRNGRRQTVTLTLAAGGG